MRRLDTRLGYLPRTAEGHSLVFGNPRASKPVYDLPRFADRIRADGVVKATLGLSSVQTAPSPPEPPWLDRNPWVLWVALLAGFLVICLLIARQVREARDRP